MILKKFEVEPKEKSKVIPKDWFVSVRSSNENEARILGCIRRTKIKELIDSKLLKYEIKRGDDGNTGDLVYISESYLSPMTTMFPEIIKKYLQQKLPEGQKL